MSTAQNYVLCSQLVSYISYKDMRTSTLFLILTIATFILLSCPEESEGVIFVLSHGKVSKWKKRVNREERKKRRKTVRKDNNRKKRKQGLRRKMKELKRWFARFTKKNKRADNGERGTVKKRIWTSRRKSQL